MRVRGFWPYFQDREIRLPIPQQAWVSNDTIQRGSRDDGGEDDDGDEGDNSDAAVWGMPLEQTPMTSTNPLHPTSIQYNRNADIYTGRTMTMTNPFADADALKALKRSFAEQPNWKAAVIEGESWGGTAAENIARYQELVGTAP
jgi:hypothetical protein